MQAFYVTHSQTAQTYTALNMAPGEHSAFSPCIDQLSSIVSDAKACSGGPMRNLRSLARREFASDRMTWCMCWVDSLVSTHPMVCSMRVANLVPFVDILLPDMTTHQTKVVPSLLKSSQAFCTWEVTTTLRGLNFSKQSALHIS